MKKLWLGPIGKSIAALVGLVLVYSVLQHAGFDAVIGALKRAAPVFPIVLFLELAILACTMCGLRLLYLEDRHRIPLKELIRAGFIGYALMGLVPAGRTVAESARAALLAKYSTAARAAVAATQLQGVALLANAVISLFAAIATWIALDTRWPTLPAWMIFCNFVIATALGFGILFAGSRSGVGAWLGKRISWIRRFGQDFDREFSNTKLVPIGPFLWEFFGRVLQVLQNAVLVVAVGGAFGLISALCSEGLHLVGAALGDLIPGQLGATEASYQLSAHALSLSPADAVCIALLAHVAQLIWVSVSLVVPLVWPATHDPVSSFLPNPVNLPDKKSEEMFNGLSQEATSARPPSTSESTKRKELSV